MPILPTALVTASSANQNISNLNAIATNFLATSSYVFASSTVIGSASLTAFASNLINTSGVLNAASAVMYAGAMNNVMASSTLFVMTSSTGLSLTNQLLQASSAITSMLLQLQSGYQVSS